MNPFLTRFDDLPDSLPVFPLPGAVVMPGGELPLNIFEPRYLNMVQDALALEHMFGMVQPLDGVAGTAPALHHVGCAGRITAYQETSDGRIELVLTGLCRFDIVRELDGRRGYRIVEPDWRPYRIDYDEARLEPHDREMFEGILRRYMDYKSLDVDWQLLASLPTERLINSLVGALPLEGSDKQMLLETVESTSRLKVFSAILEAQTAAQKAPH